MLYHRPVFVSLIRPDLSAGASFIETLATIYRSAFTGLERYFRILSTFSTDYGVHLAGSVTTTGSVTLVLSRLPAGRASFGFIGVSLGLEELLFFSTESKGGTAIGTLECFILKTQRMTSFLRLVG